MKTAILGIVLLVLTTCTASAATWDDGVEKPPAPYDHVPDGHLLEIQMPYGDVDGVCAPFKHDYIEQGCAQPDSFHLIVLSMNPALPAEYRALIKAALAFDPNYKGIVIPTCHGFWSYISCEMQDHIRRHEWGHDNGLIHCADGRGWCLVVQDVDHIATDQRRCVAGDAAHGCLVQAWIRRIED